MAKKILNVEKLDIKMVVMEILIKKPSDLGWSKTGTSGCSTPRLRNKMKSV